MSEITKRALAQSLKNLLAQKPLNKITIGDIAEDCGINRMTFYYHFKDIYDLAEWTCIDETKKVLNGKKTYDTWQEGLLNIFHAVSENKALILNVYRCVHREQIEMGLNPLVSGLLLSVIDEKSTGLYVLESDKKFIADFYEYAFVGVMMNWIQNGMQESPEVLVKKISTLLHGNFTKALQDFSIGKSTSNSPD
ncbi:MAG: TetR/AcrR family transcriptional regulator [Candidatus Fimenecus sp.]